MKMKKIYLDQKTFVKFDDKRYLAYLNEVVINDYVPEVAEGEEIPEPQTAYQYEGPEPDGGTMIEAVSEDRDNLINGIIRSRYSQTEEDAIKTHQIELLHNSTIDKADEYRQEWADFNSFRLEAIATVDKWING